MKTPYPYETRARYWLNRQLNQGNNPALVMPAGSGKTFTATLVIKDRIALKKRLLVLCGTEEIFDQWQVEFSENNINYGYINPEGIIGRNKSVYICMWQSLYNILTALPEKFVTSFDEIFTDETHHSSSPTLEGIYEHFEHCQRVGLTATLYRMDNKPLGKYYNTMYEPITQSKAIEQGFLCEPIIIVPDEYKIYVPKNIDEVENINKSDQRKNIQDKKIIGDMIKVYKDVFAGEPCMIACSSHAHAIIVAGMYREHGWIVEHLHGTLNKTDRKMIIRKARQKKINIIVTYAVGTEGLDIKELMGIIWMRLTESLTVWIQLNMRAARVFKKKKNYILIDPMGNLLLHGSPALDRKWSLETDYIPGQDVPDAPQSRICPVCGVVNSIDNGKCWICGYNFMTGMIDGELVSKKKRRLPKMIDGELVYLDEEKIWINDNKFIINRKTTAVEIEKKVQAELTKTQKIEILSRDLVGLKMKNKFREGLKWL